MNQGWIGVEKPNLLGILKSSVRASRKPTDKSNPAIYFFSNIFALKKNPLNLKKYRR